MIHTARQLKALIRNISKSDSTKAQILIRNYMMERFLERLSVSSYKNNFILKGGMLISSIVGLDNRSTMDVDTTIKGFELSEDNAVKIINEIVAIDLEDGVVFQITSIYPIMDDADYSGIRVNMNTTLEMMQTPLKIDLSTGDAITPCEITYSYKLMFEDRDISILAYNLETILAEKIETILSRGEANTRMRDYYDVFILSNVHMNSIDIDVLKQAYMNTATKRNSIVLTEDLDLIIDEINSSSILSELWGMYKKKNEYAIDIEWSKVLSAFNIMFELI